MEPDLVADYLCETGESPIWHPMERRLYWTDIPTGRKFWFDPATGQYPQFYQGASVGGFTVQKDEVPAALHGKGGPRGLQRRQTRIYRRGDPR